MLAMHARVSSLIQSARTAFRLLAAGELAEILRRRPRALGGRGPIDPPALPPADLYQAWLSVNRWTPKARKHLVNSLAEHDWAHLQFTVLVSVEERDLSSLPRTLQSLDEQLDKEWDALVVASHAALAQAEGIVALVLRERARVVAAQDVAEALPFVNGWFVLPLRAGDTLGPEALAEFALELADYPGTDLIYCDDDECEEDGTRLAPRFKPPWSREIYMTLALPRQTVLVWRAVLENLSSPRLFTDDPLREILAATADTDLQVRHLPLVLHHRKSGAGVDRDSGPLLARFDASVPLNPNLTQSDEGVSIVPRRIVRGTLPPIRTLMFTPNLNREGAPYSQFELARALRDHGVIEPEVVSFRDGPLRDLYRGVGIPVHVRVEILSEIPTLRRYELAVARLARFIRRRKPDLVYANTLLNFPAIEAAERAGVPTLWNPRESEPWETYFNFLSQAVAKRAMACFLLPYRVVFVAHATRTAWSRFGVRNNFTVIHNGLDMRRFAAGQTRRARSESRIQLGLGDDEVMVLLLGTMCERKGQRDLAAALARLDPGVTERARFFIVGDEPGRYSENLRRDVANLPHPAAERVEIVPTTSDVGTYYLAADIFVLTSRVESFPRVTLEAMAHALPIITTPAFGVIEQVVEGRNALFYPAGDAIKLAAALATVIEDSALRILMGKASKSRLAEITTFEEMVGGYAELIKEAYLSR